MNRHQNPKKYIFEGSKKIGVECVDNVQNVPCFKSQMKKKFKKNIFFYFFLVFYRIFKITLHTLHTLHFFNKSIVIINDFSGVALKCRCVELFQGYEYK